MEESGYINEVGFLVENWEGERVEKKYSGIKLKLTRYPLQITETEGQQ